MTGIKCNTRRVILEAAWRSGGERTGDTEPGVHSVMETQQTAAAIPREPDTFSRWTVPISRALARTASSSVLGMA